MRWISSLARMMVIILFITFISAATSWYAVQLYAKQVMAQFEINTDIALLPLSKLFSTFTSEEQSHSSPGALEEGLEDQKSVQDNEVPVFGNSLYDDVSTRQELALSLDDFQRKRDLMSEEDKMKVFTLLFTRLPQQEMLRITSVVEDGITLEELEKVEEMVKEHLNPEEYQSLLQIIDKY